MSAPARSCRLDREAVSPFIIISCSMANTNSKCAFVDSPWQREGLQQPRQVDFGRGSDEQYDGYAAVDTVMIRGPYQPAGSGNTASRRIVFVCRPTTAVEEGPCARRIVSTLARRAY